MKIKDNKPQQKEAFKSHILKEYKKSFDCYPEGPQAYEINVTIKYEGIKEYYTFEFIHGASSDYTKEFIELCELYPAEYQKNDYKQYMVNIYSQNKDFIGGGDFEQKIESNSLSGLIDKIFNTHFYGYFVGFGYMLID